MSKPINNSVLSNKYITILFGCISHIVFVLVSRSAKTASSSCDKHLPLLYMYDTLFFCYTAINSWYKQFIVWCEVKNEESCCSHPSRMSKGNIYRLDVSINMYVKIHFKRPPLRQITTQFNTRHSVCIYYARNDFVYRLVFSLTRIWLIWVPWAMHSHSTLYI